MRTKTAARILSANTLTGTDVRNPEGENLGHLKELMIDTDMGQISYAVLSFGGFLGLGDKLFALPWPAFQVDPENESLILDVDKETLESAPGFDKDDWPGTADQAFVIEVYEHYGYEPYWK